MNKRTALAIAAGISLVATGPAPASVKPCLGKDGRVVECPKPRKASPRCKDAAGKFTACPAPSGGKADGKRSPG